MKADKATAAWFLQQLYDGLNGEQIEFRCIRGSKPNSEVTRHFTTLPVNPGMLSFLEERNSEGFNIYFGVATRVDKKPNIIPALWADIDFKTLTPSLIGHKEGTVLSLLRSELQPSVIVGSGNGIHAYWFTHIDVTQDNRTEIKTANQKIAKRFDGDAVGDPERVLRLPGYFNVKNIANPVACKVLVGQNRGIIRYSFDELQLWLADVSVPTIDGELEELIEKGNTGKYASRSEADFAAVMGLVQRGFADEDIIEIFDNKPIGEKYREKGSYGADYLDRTIEAARRRMKYGG
jgi:hypothetical protein